jgi:hypothetical protein
MFKVDLHVLGISYHEHILLLIYPILYLLHGRFPPHFLPSTCSTKCSGLDNKTIYWLDWCVTDPGFDKIYQQNPIGDGIFNIQGLNTVSLETP